MQILRLECTSTLECESLSVRAVEASYGYMCGIGNQQFKEHADCFSRVENRAEYIHCRSVAGQEMDKATNKKYENNGEKFNDKTQQSQLCFTMNNYLDCCKPLVERSCGSKAWELVAKITRDSLRVSLPDCVLTSIENG
uniref:DUF19 domain-containing protein n=1 Tax=Meloidogyne incognita TaxID=6306 RepID=A0A914NET9_MELIC